MFRRSQNAAGGDASQLQSGFAVLMIAAGEVPVRPIRRFWGIGSPCARGRGAAS